MNERSGMAAAGPAGYDNGLSISNFDEFELQLEELFDKADDLMINQKKYAEAVSWQHKF